MICATCLKQTHRARHRPVHCQACWLDWLEVDLTDLTATLSICTKYGCDYQLDNDGQVTCTQCGAMDDDKHVVSTNPGPSARFKTKH